MAGDSPNGMSRDYSSELEALHLRQNLLEEREIRNGTRIAKVEDGHADHRDWIVRALGPIQEQLHLIRTEHNGKLSSLEKAIRKLFAKLDEHGMGRKPTRKKQAQRPPRK